MARIRISSLINDGSIPLQIANDIRGIELNLFLPRRFVCLGCNQPKKQVQHTSDAFLVSSLEIMNALRSKGCLYSAEWFVQKVSQVENRAGNDVVLIGKEYCEEI